MSIKIIEGSLLDTNARYICHQVNCQGKMNSGVAKAIRERWPGVYELYKAYCANKAPNDLLGHCQYVDVDINKKTTVKYKAPNEPLDHCQSMEVETSQKTIINLFSQENYGYDGRKYTSYDAFWNCLKNIYNTASKGSTIAFPYGIGCVRGGASWTVIYKMIEEVLGEEYNVEIRRLDVG